MPVWVLVVLLVYLSLLLLAALWAAVERTRSARQGTRQLPHAEPLEQ